MQTRYQLRWTADREKKATNPTCVIYEAVRGDGNCLFRCFAMHLYNDAEKYMQVKNELADFVLSDPERKIQGDEPISCWIQLCDIPHESIDDYVNWLRTPRNYGGGLECAIASELYDLTIFVHCDHKVLYSWKKSTLNIMHVDFDPDSEHYMLVKPFY